MARDMLIKDLKEIDDFIARLNKTKQLNSIKIFDNVTTQTSWVTLNEDKMSGDPSIINCVKTHKLSLNLDDEPELKLEFLNGAYVSFPLYNQFVDQVQSVICTNNVDTNGFKFSVTPDYDSEQELISDEEYSNCDVYDGDDDEDGSVGMGEPGEIDGELIISEKMTSVNDYITARNLINVDSQNDDDDDYYLKNNTKTNKLMCDIRNFDSQNKELKDSIDIKNVTQSNDNFGLYRNRFWNKSSFDVSYLNVNCLSSEELLQRKKLRDLDERFDAMDRYEAFKELRTIRACIYNLAHNKIVTIKNKYTNKVQVINGFKKLKHGFVIIDIKHV
jgi:hypothetical protein